MTNEVIQVAQQVLTWPEVVRDIGLAVCGAVVFVFLIRSI